MTQRRITDDLHALLGVLPPQIQAAVVKVNNSDNLLEIVIDLGRYPMARFTDGEVQLLDQEITHAEIEHVVTRIGDFDADNRAGLERTLHRISAIRNRRGHIVGLTCRVGRAVYGTIDIIQDLVESGKSLLILGRPGIGKTTMLREAARILADQKRVVIVDTSNEIGGDGDVPHPAVGRARRMQVAKPSLQHEVMIEAVENHNPEVIVIDEIGRELEAAAARTIAERGVQLIGTAHGRTLENLLLNPTLSDLVGGIEAVTLSDEEARRRGTQKTVLERRSPPTFDVLIEIQDRDHLAIHPDVAAAVDALVRSYPLQPELRSRDAKGEIHIEKPPENTVRPVGMNFGQGQSQGQGGAYNRGQAGFGLQNGMLGQSGMRRSTAEPSTQPRRNGEPQRPVSLPASTASEAEEQPQNFKPVHIYPYGVARNRLVQSAKRLGVPAIIVRELTEADALITLRTYYRGREQTILEAEGRGLPIYVLRANTNSQIEQMLAELFNLAYQSSNLENWEETASATQAAIQMVMNGERYVDLTPASAAIRRMQHEMIRQAELTSHSYGKEPNRRVRVYRD